MGAAGACIGPCNTRAKRELGDYKTSLAAYAEAATAHHHNPALPEPAVPEPPADVRLWPGEPIYCRRCTATIRRELAEISDLAAIAEAHATGHRRGPDSQRVSGSRHSPSPSPVIEDLDELASILRDWEAAARHADTLPRRGYLASEIATLCARLSTACFPTLVENPDTAGDFGREIHTWHRRLRDATRTGTGRHMKRRPCPRCDRYSLLYVEGEQYIACQTEQPKRCGYLMSLTDWEDYDRIYPHLKETAGAA